MDLRCLPLRLLVSFAAKSDQVEADFFGIDGKELRDYFAGVLDYKSDKNNLKEALYFHADFLIEVYLEQAFTSGWTVVDGAALSTIKLVQAAILLDERNKMQVDVFIGIRLLRNRYESRASLSRYQTW